MTNKGMFELNVEGKLPLDVTKNLFWVCCHPQTISSRWGWGICTKKIYCTDDIIYGWPLWGVIHGRDLETIFI